jgi:hypothetical protein
MPPISKADFETTKPEKQQAVTRTGRKNSGLFGAIQRAFEDSMQKVTQAAQDAGIKLPPAAPRPAASTPTVKTSTMPRDVVNVRTPTSSSQPKGQMVASGGAAIRSIPADLPATQDTYPAPRSTPKPAPTPSKTAISLTGPEEPQAPKPGMMSKMKARYKR